MLKYQISKLDDVHEAHRGLYVQRDSGFVLDVVGIESPESLRASRHAEKLANNAARGKLAELEKQVAEADQRRAADASEAAQRRVEFEASFNADAEKKHAQKLAEATASLQAQVESLRADRDRVTEDNTVADIANELARAPEYRAVLIPHIRQRLQGCRDENGRFTETVRAEVTAHLRGDAAFAPIIRGASPAERAFHAKRVQETLGGAKAAQKPMTRGQFQALSPAQRSERVRAGVTILDG